MAVRLVTDPHDKDYLNPIVNDVTAYEINVGTGDVIDFKAGSSLNLQGSTGTSGNIVIKDGSNDLAWSSTLHFGDKLQFQESTAPETDNSGAWHPLTDTFLYASAPAGTYLFQWAIEAKNPSGVSFVKITDALSAEYQHWMINGSIDTFTEVSGFKVITFAVPTTITFKFEIQSLTPTHVTTANHAKFTAYRIS